MSEIEFKDEEVKSFIKNLNSRLKDVVSGKSKYVGLLSAIIFADVMDHFKKEEGPNGKWKPWSAAYREAMDAAGYGGNKILQFNGRMRQNFKPSSSRVKGGAILWFNDAQTKDGFGYAGHHNETREFMWASDRAIEKIEMQTLAFMMDEGI